MKIIPNYLRNAPELVAYAKSMDDRFMKRVGTMAHESMIPGVFSKFKTLTWAMPPSPFLDLIFKDSDFDPFLRDSFSFIQIQKYDVADYIAPHRDAYDITKLHLITLTTSPFDGLVCENEEHELVFIPDVAGNYIDFPYDAAHYVSPVRETRYSLVIGE